MYEDLTVLVVDRDERCRVALVTALRRLGLRALGLTLPREALDLLYGLAADVGLLRGAEEDDPALPQLRRRMPLMVELGEDATVEETLLELLRALGRPEAAAEIN